MAIVLAVATVFSLSGFSLQIKQALLNESTSFIAADRVLQSSRPADAKVLAQSDALNLQRAEQVLMTSIVFAGDEMLLADIKAVSTSYPLRGELIVDNKPVHAPPLGHVFVEAELLTKLNISIGDNVDIGESSFIIAGIAQQVPDASFSVFTAGPKAIINIADIGKTQLIQPGSRLTYKYLFAGEHDAIERFEQWIKPQINDAQRWYDIKSRQSPLANALDRAEKFLSLASMLGIILAAVAVAVASRRYGQRHQSTVAVFKAMGASVSHVRKVYYLHWTLLSVFSISLGLIVGYILEQIGLMAIAQFISLDSANSSFNIVPFFTAIFTGLICAIAFAIAPLKHLIATSPLAVVRGFSASFTFKHSLLWQFLPAILALFTLLLMFSGDFILTLALMAGGIVVSGILLLLSNILMNAGRVVGSQAGGAWHLAMANLKRRAKDNSVQLVSFTIAIKLLLLILVMRGALLNDWQAQLPENAPNLFLVNISGEQAPKVEKFIDEQSIIASDLYAVVRGRLTAINQDHIASKNVSNNVTKKVSKEDDETDQANNREGVGRELNLTWREQLPNENSIVAGKWFSSNSANQAAQVSVEETLAKRLDINLHDQLTFQLGSESIHVTVTSIRKVNWQSMQPNFYMIFNAQVLADFPATFISSLYVPKAKKVALQHFLSQFPTISLIDVDALISQLRSVIAQVSVAIEFILVLVVIAGCLVLVAQVQASMEERERELAILRTLGAKGSLLRNSVLMEFIALGAIAGFMASMAMELAVYLLQTQLFKMQASFHFEYWLLGVFAGASFVGMVGLLSCRRLLNLSSVTLIRRTL